MKRYSDSEKSADDARAQKELAALVEVLERAHDVVVVSDIITITDICNLELDTAKGPQKVGDVCSREEIVTILKAVRDSPGADIALLANLVIQDVRKLRKERN